VTTVKFERSREAKWGKIHFLLLRNVYLHKHTVQMSSITVEKINENFKTNTFTRTEGLCSLCPPMSQRKI